ncbi:hypothetical protein GCM10009119_26920 [Algoriphagus jejuensis]|uniref:Oligosaccharide repeat unit polymerase n=2 Tax=Algoriphagus jejuensis TaxID=419934 RepID=A0ABN1N1I3_9BACT
MDSMVKTIPLTLIPFFFLLAKYKYPVKTLENIILVFGYIYFVLYMYQLLNPDTAYFGYALVDDTGGYRESRGVTRVVFPGAGIFWLACFISLSKLISNQGNKYILVPLVLLGLAVPVLQATRQLIGFVVILYFLHFGFQLSLAKKIIVSFLLIIGGIYVGALNLPVIEGLYQETHDTTSEGTKYIRFITGGYYLTEFSDTFYTKIMGNGFPADRSDYGAVTIRLIEKGMFLEDVGIIGLYSQVGIIGIIAWLFIWYKSFTVILPKEYYYCKYYLWMLLFTCLTSGSIYTVHYAISTTLVLYIYNQVKLNERYKLKQVIKLLLRRKLVREAHDSRRPGAPAYVVSKV